MSTKEDRGIASLALAGVLIALAAFILFDMPKEGGKMVAYNKTEEIRVVCYLPDETNRKLQAQASLDGISKQDLTRQILIDWVNNSESKAPTKRLAKKAAEPTE